MAKLQLSIALAVSEQRSYNQTIQDGALGNLTRLILEGAVIPDGIDLIPSDVYSGELIWRQLRSAEFDIAQMSVTALLMLAERGDSPWVALPVFPFRSFHHSRFQVREHANIQEPKDLHGKNMGVSEYMMTAAVWSRGVLKDEFGVEAEKITWYQERLESIGKEFGYQAPAGVIIHQIPRRRPSAQCWLLANSMDLLLQSRVLPCWTAPEFLFRRCQKCDRCSRTRWPRAPGTSRKRAFPR